MKLAGRYEVGDYVNTCCGMWPVVKRVDELCSVGDVMVEGVRRSGAGLRHATEARTETSEGRTRMSEMARLEGKRP